MRRQGSGGGAGRRRYRPRRLSRRRVRLCDPVADAAGDPAAASSARAYAADRPPRHRVVSEFRPLEDPAAAPSRRSYAAHRQSALCLVGNAEHPLLQHQGLPRTVERGRRQDGTGGCAQRLGQPDAAENAVVVLGSFRRAGGIPAQPAELTLLPRTLLI